MTSASRNPNVFPWLLAELGIGALALWATGLLSPALQPVARAAAGLGVLSGLISLFAVHLGLQRAGPNGLLAAVGVGFFARALLIGLGLVATHASGDLALGYTLVFFAVFVLTATIDIAYVFLRSRRPHGAADPLASTTR